MPTCAVTQAKHKYREWFETGRERRTCLQALQVNVICAHLVRTIPRACLAIGLEESADLNDRQFQFEWDDLKAARNLLKHDITFEHASSVFNDQGMLSLADLARSDTEDRRLSIGLASNGAMLFIVYPRSESDPAPTKIRLISAPPATRTEIRYYKENL